MSTPPRPDAARVQSHDEAGFSSKLTTPRERFLSAVVEHSLLVGRRSAKDFLRCFPPREIMAALRDQPRLRAKLLVSTTGVNEKIALKKPPHSAGEDLEIAIVEHVAQEDDVVALFDPDDRVRYLDHEKLWSFLVEGDFWRITTEAVSGSVAREHIAYILARARVEKLLTDREIVDGIGLDVLVDSLPKEELGRVIEKALGEGRSGRVFKDEKVLDVLSPFLLVEHVSLAHIWERLVANQLSFGSPEPKPAAVADPTLKGAATLPPEPKVSGPSLQLTVEDEESIVIDDDRDELTQIEVEAMLAHVSPADPAESVNDRLTVLADLNGPPKTDNGAAS